ncbi:type II secretion system protein [Domibacillus iocasae]|uniref:Prepilin-type N-terminal cleavage/methylation domain-containing protein n=1 Tax=Domibacillus iocasae TaxID=1714016 RepID=A0A1E7DMC7_9BACI|nr:type II secretion system protein [Domibacillus iocasae]OES44231.1 hypothetical protein BA724_08035 [Domibacillus iocasae]
MFKKMKSALKNEKGLTLIELLAVVVILGIIAAIAVPSIGGLIDNTKKDAHVANATQMINSAKTYVAGNANSSKLDTQLTLKEMIEDGYIDTMEDPDGGNYNDTYSFVDIAKNGNSYTYKVTLSNGDAKRKITARTLEQLDRDTVGGGTP